MMVWDPANDEEFVKGPLAKIAVGASYYLLTTHCRFHGWARDAFQGHAFADLRACFLRRGEFAAGGSGRGFGLVARSLTKPEATRVQSCLGLGDTRAHFIELSDLSPEEMSVERDGWIQSQAPVPDGYVGIRLRIALFSEHFWSIVIPGATLGVPILSETLPLPALEKLRPSGVGPLPAAPISVLISSLAPALTRQKLKFGASRQS